MKINTENLSFQKKLVAKCKIGNAGQNQKVSIYELDKKKDIMELHKAYLSSLWDDNFYLEEYTDEFEKPDKNPEDKFYIIKDEAGDVICISLLNKQNPSENAIEYIETAPKVSCYNNIDRPIKFIGETMLAFLAKMTRKEGKNLSIKEIADRPLTKNFYFKHCHFTPRGDNDAIMPNDRLKDLENMNKQHTGKKVKILV